MDKNRRRILTDTLLTDCIRSLNMSFLYATLVLFQICHRAIALDLLDLKSVKDFEDGIVQNMIERQNRLCPYVSLCTTRDPVIDFEKEYTTSIPCCTPCSCNETCVESGTCCPDFYKQLPKSIILESRQSANDKECVKVQHGPLTDEKTYKRYKMIADCPDNHSDRTVVSFCQSKFDYKSVKNLSDHIPVIDTSTNRVYKNKHCFECNNGTQKSAQLWNIKLNCTGFFRLFVYLADSPRELAEKYVELEQSCNIEFYINTRSIKVSNLELQECDGESDSSYIQSCKNEYAGTEMEAICNNYTWPIKRNRILGFEVYKNLACMICNDVTFLELCYTFSFSKFYSIIFPVDTYDLHSLETTKEMFINRSFPDMFGNTNCQNGFIFHKEKKICRRVICPHNFYIKDGHCIPLFDGLFGLSYILHLNILFPKPTTGLNTTDFESAIFIAIHQILNKYFAKNDFLFSLWCNCISPGKINQYSVVVLVTGQDDYLGFLKLVHRIVTTSTIKTLNVNLNTTATKKVLIQLEFSDFPLLDRGEPLNKRGKRLRLVAPKTWKKLVFQRAEKTSKAYVSWSFLCYRVALNESELNHGGRTFEVIETGRRLTYVDVKLNEDKFIICLKDTFGAVAKDTRYIFSVNQTGKDHRKTESGDSIRKKDNRGLQSGDGQESFKNMKTSLILVACSVGVILIIFTTKKCQQNLAQRKQNQTEEHSEIN